MRFLLTIGTAILAAASLRCSVASAQVAPGQPDFELKVKPFLERHCAVCHGEKEQKGDLRVDSLSRDFGNSAVADRWTAILDRINASEMPPKERPRPDAEEVARVAQWISSQLTEAEAVRRAAVGEKVSFRRLSRDEYRNTIRDLLGVTYDASDPAGLPLDPDWQGFERIGTVLTLSPAHVEKYLAAAETILNEALALGPQPKPEITRWSAATQRANGELGKALATRGLLDKLRIDIVPNNGALDAYDLRVATTGEYIVHVKLSGLRPEGGLPPRLRIYATDLGRTLLEQDVEAPEHQPVTLEFRTHLPAGTHLIRIVNAVHGPNPEERASRPLGTKPFFNMKSRQPWQIKLTDDQFKPIWPTLLLDWIEWEGPVQNSSPPAAHRRIFVGGDTATKDTAYAREIFSRFASRAFRRPARPDELDRLVGLFESSRKLGDSFEACVKTGLLAVLCSDSFLYLIEGSTKAASTQLTDWELASRLSYFLWSSTPDEALLDLASNGKLHEPTTLRDEARRMMRDPKASAFADSFPRQWLQLRRVGMFEPDKKIYPDYDEYLEKSMVAETTTFFGEVMHNNLSLRELLSSDWTMLNERLAQHYGIAGVRGEAMQRVALKPEDHRGGILTQASVLSLTSDGTRHRPVHRGKWILESVFGTPPPPPPPNVSAIKPAATNEPKSTLRAKIEAHRNVSTCAACHRKIDPLGLAFENYDAVGHWRTEEAVRDGAGADPKLDPSGELPNGRKFADANEFKGLLVADIATIDAAFVQKLATYALRRAMTFDDRKYLTQIAQQSEANDYRLSTLVENFVLSDLFRKR